MKKIIITLVLVACAIGCLFIWAMGSDSWAVTETVRKDLHGSIEQLIGKYKIKITKIDQAIGVCQSKTPLLIKREANALVEQEYATRELVTIGTNLESSKTSVLKLADLIEKGEDVILASGRKMTVADLSKQAELVKARHLTLKERYDTAKRIIDTYKRLGDKSNQDRVNGQYTIDLLKEKRGLLVAKVKSLNAIKEMQADEEDYRTIYQEASDLLDSVMREVDKEILFHEKMVEVSNDQTSIDREIDQLTIDSASIAAELRSVVE